MRPLSAWPLPYRGGTLQVVFATAGGLGGTATRAEVSVFDVQGRLVRRIAGGEYGAGYQAASWDGRDHRGVEVPAGVYFLRSRSELGVEKSMKLTVLR
jgi:flagellar hook assembly protein FlgD